MGGAESGKAGGKLCLNPNCLLKLTVFIPNAKFGGVKSGKLADQKFSPAIANFVCQCQ